MNVLLYFVFAAVVTVGLLGDFAMGAFVGVCVLIFYLFAGNTPPRPNSEKYEHEKPRNSQTPYNPNDFNR
jgi:MFS superfamily sulfate permease-like transporter